MTASCCEIDSFSSGSMTASGSFNMGKMGETYVSHVVSDELRLQMNAQGMPHIVNKLLVRNGRGVDLPSTPLLSLHT